MARPSGGGPLFLKGNIMFRFLLLALVIGSFGSAHAQTAPSASDIASYTGLHLAAHEGDVDVINRLIGAGADVDIRDRSQRTPAHVAAFA